MDNFDLHAHRRADHISRQAAAAAHASYYAHPALHLHTYRAAHPVELGSDEQASGAPLEPLNESAGCPAPAHSDPGAGTGVGDAVQTGEVKPSLDPDPERTEREQAHAAKEGGLPHTAGTKEEEGGKPDAGQPSGVDKGALQPNGEAGGTHTSPGPTKEQVRRYLSTGAGPETRKGDNVALPGVTAEAGQEATQGADWRLTTRMEPHLQLMCGPLLAYYTVKDGVWHGAALVVTADEGSDYTHNPFLKLSFHAHEPPSPSEPTLHAHSATLAEPRTVEAERIYRHVTPEGPMSFWRMMLQVPLYEVEQAVRYSLNGGAELDFVVPARGQNLRWAAHSCNGFSSGVNPDEFKGKYQSGYDPVWEDLILRHHQKPFHCMVGGGDQIYCDAITREPELQSWINAPNREAKLGHPLTEEMKACVDRFYFSHYCKIFRSNAFSRANSTIPMVNMLDDHDLIDGFGTYDDETQRAPVMSFIGGRGYFWFLLFQLFTVDAYDGTPAPVGSHKLQNVVIGGPGAWIPYPGHSLITYLGPKVLLLAIDCRAERKLGRINSEATYAKLFEAVKAYKGIEQLVILLGVPIAYPRMSFLEHFLDKKYNPINVLARHGMFGLGGMVNKFNQASELLDDLNDHWAANTHKKERNWLVLECQKVALAMHARITFLSGDVHLAAVGKLFTKTRKGRTPRTEEEDHRFMLNVVTSAIVNTPPPDGAATMINILGAHKHRTLHKQQTDEGMVPLFQKDTDGAALKKHLALNRRNYAAVDYEEDTGRLRFDFRVEKSPGEGETVSYPVYAPPPRWSHLPEGKVGTANSAKPATLVNGTANGAPNGLGHTEAANGHARKAGAAGADGPVLGQPVEPVPQPVAAAA